MTKNISPKPTEASAASAAVATPAPEAAARLHLRALLQVQFFVGFGLFGVGSLLMSLLLPLVWVACLGNRRRFGRATRFGVRRGFQLVFVMLKLLGFMRLRVSFEAPVRGPALLACNHISLFDVLAVIAHVPGCFTFVKAGFVRIPLIRYIILASGFIPVDPESPAQGAEAYARALSLLEEGAVFVVFPEGTRSATGALGRFQRGAFRLARQSGLPLTPVVFTGSGPLLNKRILKRADGKAVTLEMRVCAPAAHLPRENGTQEGGVEMDVEMRLLRSFLEERVVSGG